MNAKFNEFIDLETRRVIDDFQRDVWCVMGLPIDATISDETLNNLWFRARDPLDQQPLGCFLSTPNLNFAISAQQDLPFRNSVINSDWVVADGMPLIWISKKLGIPLRERVAGSSLIESFRTNQRETGDKSPLKIFFFGGPEGIAEQACQKLAAERSGIQGVGFHSPGFGDLASMSDASVIDKINDSGADILIIALGAKRGQAWIEMNRTKIHIPLISHLGAVVNFVAGTVARAPNWMQKTGLEWVWRTWEEHSLFKRYWSDGLGLIRFYFKRIRPYSQWLKQNQNRMQNATEEHELAQSGKRAMQIRLGGTYVSKNLTTLRQTFMAAVLKNQSIELNFEKVDLFDSAFVGLLLILKKRQATYNQDLKIRGATSEHHKLFFFNAVEDQFTFI